MPGAAGELIVPRWVWWAVVFVNAGVTGFFMFGAVYPSGSTTWHANFAALTCGWLALTACLYVQVIHRPRASRDVVSIDPSSASPAVVLAGSRRLTAWLAIAAGVWAFAFATFAMTASNRWWIVWATCAGFAMLGAVSQVLSLQPRSVRLTREGIDAVTNGVHAQVAWDDVQLITWVQAREGLMGLRVTPFPGARSWSATPHRPWSRRDRRFLEIDLMPLDVDPLLVTYAFYAYWKDPQSRAEFDGTGVPRRLSDPTVATADSRGRQIVVPSAMYRFEASSPR